MARRREPGTLLQGVGLLEPPGEILVGPGVGVSVEGHADPEEVARPQGAHEDGLREFRVGGHYEPVARSIPPRGAGSRNVTGEEMEGYVD